MKRKAARQPKLRIRYCTLQHGWVIDVGARQEGSF
jgi:hypothetical protein